MDRRDFIKNSAFALGGVSLLPAFSKIEVPKATQYYRNVNKSSFYNDEQVLGNPNLLSHKWAAQWISFPEGSLLGYSVYHFRKSFSLKEKPEEFIIHVSADNRYRLFLNGEEVCYGPARGDLLHWRFDSIDIAEYLNQGKNTLAAVVWNFSEYAPLAQITHKTAFILQGNSKLEEIVNTNGNWKVFQNHAYVPPAKKTPFTSVGPGDKIVGSKYPYGWNQCDFDDSSWETPKLLGRGVPIGKFTAWDWMLVPRNIPFMEHTFQRINKVERAKGTAVGKGFLEGKSPLRISSHKKVSILLDQTFLTTAYPKLITSGGEGATVKIGYAEALVDDEGRKGNRNETRGKHLKSAFWDVFKPDGGRERKFSPLWFRTYRYMRLDIETRENPLTIHDLYGYFTAYPFKERASFKSDDPLLKRIWDTGWRTARLCAGETYYDSPYYEQLQYIGDTRIEALISLYVAGDDRLMRNAIAQFYHSLLPMGLTQARYPCSQPQVIPPFSLFWIYMIHDFWMHRDDLEFLKNYQHGIKSVLAWYKKQVTPNGILGSMDWWNFVDWSFGPWNAAKPTGGVPKGGMKGGSSIITLLYAYALQKAADLFDAFDEDIQSQQYRQRAKTLVKSVYTLCWSKRRQLLADTLEKETFSQHANIMGILTGMFGRRQEKAVMAKVLNDPDLIQTTFYFKFYLFRAMNKAGFANKYLQQLGPWKKMIDIGLTTFAETPEPTRSDCHGWSAHPIYDLLATVCGIKPGSPGFKTVFITPHLGNLNYVNGKVPHPKGDIIVNLMREGKKSIKGKIILPEGLTGKFVWQNLEITLHEGKQHLEVG
jgi:hypothetical protein